MDDATEVRAGRLRNFRRSYMCHRYAILFYSLLFILVAVPVLNMFKSGAVLIESLLAANLLAAIMPVNLGKNRNILLPVMIVVWLARPLALWLDHHTLSVITFGIWTLIGLTAAAAALRYAFRATTINAEHVYAALSAYLLAGLYFGLFYWGPRTAQIRRVHHIRKFFPNDRNLLQLRDTCDTGLWRHRASHRRGAKRGHFGRCRRTTLSGRAGRAIG